MAQNKLPVLVLLLLVFCLQIQCIVGRHLVLKQSHNFHKVQTYGRVVAKETGTIFVHKMNLHGDNINKAAVANTQSPPSPPSVVIGGATQAPPPKNADDFRPTAPGHSPGVGHSLQN
ncbi:hypothetical protein PTKIN_Ptkin07bG0277300 [Pterospermum kingtungense]